MEQFVPGLLYVLIILAASGPVLGAQSPTPSKPKTKSTATRGKSPSGTRKGTSKPAAGKTSASKSGAEKSSNEKAAANPAAETADTTSAAATPAPRIITHGDRQSPMVALTFDDGPHPKLVPQLLALLRAENVKATFFLVGEPLKLYPDAARAILADGHEIGNHSLTHLSLEKRSAQPRVEEQIAGMQRLIEETLGTTPTLFRPAGGGTSAEVRRVCEREHLTIVTWDVDPNDWKEATTREMVVKTVLDGVTSGSIILLHVTREKTVQATAELIPILKFRKFQLVTVSELLADRALREEARRNAPPRAATGPAAPSGRLDAPVYEPALTRPTTPVIETPILPTP